MTHLRPRFAAWLALAFVTSSAQAVDLRPMEECMVQALNQTTRVEPNGAWHLTNIPVTGGKVRVRIHCSTALETRSGQSSFVTLLPGRSNAISSLGFAGADAGPTSLLLTLGTNLITAPGATAPVTVTGRFPNGVTRDLTLGSTGTTYQSTNPVVASVSPDGAVTAHESGTVVIGVIHDGVSAAARLTVRIGNDSDGDGMPDDYETSVGLDPSDPTDGLVDSDADGLVNTTEFAQGTSPFKSDTDGDGLDDGEELATGADGFVTSPTLADTDGDRVPDGIEGRTGSDPNSAESVNFSGALESLHVVPATVNLYSNPLLGDTFAQVKVIGVLLGGAGVDLTTHPKLLWVSFNTSVAGFTPERGKIVAVTAGATTVRVAAGTHIALVPVTVSAFSPTALGYVALGSAAHGVHLARGVAHVATDKGLSLVSASAGQPPVLLGQLTLASAARDVRVVGTIAYVATASSGLVVVDVTDPTAPTIVTSLSLSPAAVDLSVTGSLLLAAAGTAVHVIDVTVPAAPLRLASPPVPSGSALGISAGGISAGGVSAGGARAAVALGSAGLVMLDLASPTVPTFGTATAFSAPALDVSLSGDTALVAAGNSGLSVLDVKASLSAPKHLITMGTESFKLNDIATIGTLAFGADYFRVNSVPVIQWAAPANPFLASVVEFSMYSDANGDSIDVDGFVVAMTGSTHVYIGQYRPLADTGAVPPTITLDRPTWGDAFVEGSQVTVSANATDDVAVASVAFWVDGQLLATDTLRPFTASWTAVDPASLHTVRAVATDLAGNSATTETVTFAVIVDPLTTVTGVAKLSNGAAAAGVDVSVIGAKVKAKADATGAFTLAGVPTWQPIRLAITGTVGTTYYAQGAGPYTPVLGGITNVGTIVLTSTAPSITLGPIASAPVLYEAFENAYPSGPPNKMGPIASVAVLYEAFDTAYPSGAASLMGSFVSAAVLYEAFDTAYPAGTAALMGPIVSAAVLYEAFDNAYPSGPPTIMGPIASAPVLFEAYDNAYPSGPPTLMGSIASAPVLFEAFDTAYPSGAISVYGPVVSEPVMYATEPIVVGVSPTSLSRSAGPQTVVLHGSGFDGATTVRLYRAGVVDTTVTSSGLSLDPTGAYMTATLTPTAATTATGSAVLVVTSPSGTSVTTSHSGGVNTITVAP